MNVTDLIQDVEQAGGQLALVDGRLRVSNDTGPLPQGLVTTLRQHKAEIITVLRAQEGQQDVPEHFEADPIIAAFLDSFPPSVESIPFRQPAMDAVKAGYAVRVWLGVVNEWAWWVRGEVEREKLLAEGAKEPIYTLGELAVIVNMSDQAIKNMHALKGDMGAVIRPAGQDGKRKN